MILKLVVETGVGMVTKGKGHVEGSINATSILRHETQ